MRLEPISRISRGTSFCRTASLSLLLAAYNRTHSPRLKGCEAHLIVEVDGASHNGTVERDAVRDEWLALHGYRTLRVANTDVRDQLEGVLILIEQTCSERASGK